jgi:hypothetical protein
VVDSFVSHAQRTRHEWNFPPQSLVGGAEEEFGYPITSSDQIASSFSGCRRTPPPSQF